MVVQKGPRPNFKSCSRWKFPKSCSLLLIPSKEYLSANDIMKQSIFETWPVMMLWFSAFIHGLALSHCYFDHEVKTPIKLVLCLRHISIHHMSRKMLYYKQHKLGTMALFLLFFSFFQSFANEINDCNWGSDSSSFGEYLAQL